MTADDLLPVFDDAAKAARTALEPLTGAARRARTERPGQYALDLVADAAVLPILHEAGVAVVSEESGRSGRDDAAITVVLDPVDGSTNGSAALELCDVASGALDAYLTSWQAPWDYLGGVLVCREAGAVVVDAHGGELVVTGADARRQLLAAATPELLDAVRPALPS